MSTFPSLVAGTIDRNSPFTGESKATPSLASVAGIVRERDNYLREVALAALTQPGVSATLDVALGTGALAWITIRAPSLGTDRWRASGYFKIDSEIFAYAAKQKDSADTGRLVTITRAQFGTAIAAHLVGATVYEYLPLTSDRVASAALARFGTPASPDPLVVGTIGGNNGIRTVQLQRTAEVTWIVTVTPVAPGSSSPERLFTFVEHYTRDMGFPRFALEVTFDGDEAFYVRRDWQLDRRPDGTGWDLQFRLRFTNMQQGDTATATAKLFLWKETNS